MPDIEIYTNPMCGFCARAKQLLDAKGVEYREYDIWSEKGRKAEMVQRAGGRTSVPQIFIDQTHIGGCDDIFALEQQGNLDAKLAGDPA